MSPRNAFFGMLGILGLILAGGVGVYYYFNNDLETLNTEVGELLAEQEVVGSQILSYEVTQKKVEELAFVQDLANDVLPDSKEQANVVAEIKQFVNDAGLQLETLSFNSGSTVNTGLSNTQTEAVQSLAGVRVLPAVAVISSGATYNDILNLLQKIENNQRKMQVTEISLTPVPGSDRLTTTTVKINIYLRAAVAIDPAETTEATQ